MLSFPAYGFLGVRHRERARDRQATKTVDNTRLFHSVVSIEPNIIAVRKLSCFCDPCLQNDGERVNAAYVDPYVCKDVRTGKTTIFPEDNLEEETQSEKLMLTKQNQQPPPPVTNPEDPEDPPKEDTCSKQDTRYGNFVAKSLHASSFWLMLRWNLRNGQVKLQVNDDFAVMQITKSL